jgi:sigma-B regulation protein RsbU (phosphoserine phosphatase)
MHDMETERRRSERLLLRPPLAGAIGEHPVEIHELGPLGGRVEHVGPIVGPAPMRLVLEWDGDRIALDCNLAHSEKIEVSNRFSSGLAFLDGAEFDAGLRRVVDAMSAREQIDRLKTIVEASKLINSSIEADQLFDSILRVAREELEVERGTLYFVDEQRQEIWSKVAAGLDGVQEIRLPIGKGLAGSVAATGEAIVLHDAYGDPRFDRSHDQKTGYRTRSMLCVPINNRERRVVGVLQLLNKKQGSFGQRDLEFLDAISEHMAIAMENATLHMDLIEKNRMERELQLGREIQSRLFPKPPGDVSGIQLDARSVPCFEVGGDYYDFIELPDGDLGIAIGDVSGKGVAAALIMSSL